MKLEKKIKKIERIQFLLKRIQVLLNQLEKIIGTDLSSQNLTRIIEQVNPIFRVAFLGDLNSGKSSLINALLDEKNTNYFCSVSSSNETTVPLYIKYAETPSIITHYFSYKLIDTIEEAIRKEKESSISSENRKSGDLVYLEKINKTIKSSHRIIQVNNKDSYFGIEKEETFDDKSYEKLLQRLHYLTAASSDNHELDCIAQVDFNFNNKFLQTTKNLEFIDCVGLGDANPVAEIKLNQVLKNVPDLIVYVFSDRSVGKFFNKIVNSEGIKKVIDQERFIIVINKIETFDKGEYKSRRMMSDVLEKFKKTLARSCPLIEDSVDNIKYFPLSLHAIEDIKIGGKLRNRLSGKILKNEIDDLKTFSNLQLRKLRKYLQKSQPFIDKSTKHISAFKGQLSSIFEIFEILEELTEETIDEQKSFYGELIDQMILASEELKISQKNESEVFVQLIEREYKEFSSNIDWNIYVLSVDFTNIGDSKKSYRDIAKFALKLSKEIYDSEFSKLYDIVIKEIDNLAKSAFERYVQKQDSISQVNFQKRVSNKSKIFSHQPFSVSLQGQRDIFSSRVNDPLAEANRKRQFFSFANQYFHRFNWDISNRSRENGLKKQLSKGLQKCFREYIDAYFLGKGLFAYSWDKSEFVYQQAQDYLIAIDKNLENHLNIYLIKRELYTPRLFVQKNKEKIRQNCCELIELSKEVISLID